MSVLASLPATAVSALLALFGVPALYRHEAAFRSTALLLFLLALVWVLFRGYRNRIVGPHDPWHLAGYAVVFLAIDQMVNLYCFLAIELPLECPWVAQRLDSFLPVVLAVTSLWGLKLLFVDWVVLGVTLRVMACRRAWSLAARIAVYSLPASLLLALPGADSWMAGLAGWVIAQVFTLWRLEVERALE